MAKSLSSTATQEIYRTNIVNNVATIDASSNTQQKKVHDNSAHTRYDVMSSMRSNYDSNSNAISYVRNNPKQSHLQYSSHDTQYNSHHGFPSIDLLYNILGKIPQPLQHSEYTQRTQYEATTMPITSHCTIKSNIKYPNRYIESKPSIVHNYAGFSRLPSVNNEANVQKGSFHSVYEKNTTTSTSRLIVPNISGGANMNGSYDNLRNPSALNVHLDDQDTNKSIVHYYWDCCEWTQCTKYGLIDVATVYWDESSWLSIRPNLVIVEPKSIENILFLSRLQTKLSLIYVYMSKYYCSIFVC